MTMALATVVVSSAGLFSCTAWSQGRPICLYSMESRQAYLPVQHGRPICLYNMAGLFACTTWQAYLPVQHGRPICLYNMAYIKAGLSQDRSTPMSSLSWFPHFNVFTIPLPVSAVLSKGKSVAEQNCIPLHIKNDTSFVPEQHCVP